jgi:hypothetical protein
MLIRFSARLTHGVGLCALFAAATPRVVEADPSAPPVLGARPPAAPRPSASPTPVPSASPCAAPTPRALGLHVENTLSTTFIDQNTAGPGQIAPEAPGFISGLPLAPNTPYDLFSSAPQVPGIAGIGQLITTATYRTKAFDLGLTTGLGYVRGSVTNAAFWSEDLMPTLNPHLGSQALPYAVTFPTHPGQDDGTGFRASVLSGSIATADGNLKLRGGWFDLAQTNRFVFVQPALTSVNPAIAYAPAESLGNGAPALDSWQPEANALPLHGADVVAKHGLASLELTSAALPSLPGDDARMTMGSMFIDHGEGTVYSAQYLHAQTSGTPFITTVPFGTDPTFVMYPQGVLPTSMLSGQRQTIVGAHASFHLSAAAQVDGVADVGRSWYDASPVAEPGTEKPGGYYHLGFSKKNGRATAFVDLYRMEPRYATMILPYGVPENQWSVAFAWPGQWLKSNYQLIDNSVLGVNRQGYRLRYNVDHGPLEVHLEYTDLRQIEPETTVTSLQAGFVDGYYLPQAPDAATFGRQKRYGFWTAWHPRFGDLTLDVVDDTLHRPYAPGHLTDQVSYEVPQAVLTYSRHLSSNVVAATGIGRYAMKGAFSEPIDFAQRLFFVGAQIQETPKAALDVTFRRSAFGGITTFPASPLSPNFTASTLIVEQRVQF